MNFKLLKLPFAAVVVLIISLCLSIQAHAQSYLGEVFVCNYDGDSTMDDLLKARDFYLKQAEKAGTATPPAFVWTPVKGPGEFDFLWFNYYENATQYGENMVAEAASAEIQAAGERFEAMSSCASFLFMEEQVYDGGELAGNGETAYVTSSACNLREGVAPAAIGDLRTHVVDYLESGSNKRLQVYMRNSMTPTPSTPDVRIYAVHDDAAAWGRFTDEMRASEAGQMLGRHWNSVLDCSTAHSLGRQVVAGPEQDG